jgi:hypothetical protein
MPVVEEFDRIIESLDTLIKNIMLSSKENIINNFIIDKNCKIFNDLIEEFDVLSKKIEDENIIFKYEITIMSIIDIYILIYKNNYILPIKLDKFPLECSNINLNNLYNTFIIRCINYMEIKTYKNFRKYFNNCNIRRFKLLYAYKYGLMNHIDVLQASTDKTVINGVLQKFRYIYYTINKEYKSNVLYNLSDEYKLLVDEIIDLSLLNLNQTNYYIDMPKLSRKRALSI